MREPAEMPAQTRNLTAISTRHTYKKAKMIFSIPYWVKDFSTKCPKGLVNVSRSIQMIAVWTLKSFKFWLMFGSLNCFKFHLFRFVLFGSELCRDSFISVGTLSCWSIVPAWKTFFKIFGPFKCASNLYTKIFIKFEIYKLFSWIIKQLHKLFSALIVLSKVLRFFIL